MRVILLFIALCGFARADLVTPFALNTTPISIALTASQTSGASPLGVVFNTIGTTATATAKPFHEILYTWSFDDPTSGNWATGVNPGIISKNAANGPIAAHVFTSAGTFNVCVTGFDGANTSPPACVAITVNDDNAVFSGSNTVCIANVTATAGAGGCPGGAATPAGTSDFDATLTTCAGTGKRCIFKRGDTFTASTQTNISAAGPMSIGAYGSGNAPLILSSNVSGVISLQSGSSDIRIQDLQFTGAGASDTTGAAIVIAGSVNKITAINNVINDIGKGIIVSGSNQLVNSVIQENTIFDIHAASGGVGIFGKMVTSAVMGNQVGPFATTAEHNIRMQPGQKSVISNNTATTPGNTGKTNLTLRAGNHATGPLPDPINDTEFVYIAQNVLNGGDTSVQLFEIAPASNSQNNWISNIIVDGNQIVFGSIAQQGLYGQSVNLTVRNNLCDAGIGANGRSCFITYPTNTTGNVPNPNNNQYLNNTCYSGTANSETDCIVLNATINNITNSVVKNNLAYAPLASTAKLLNSIGAGVTGTVTGGNSMDSQVKNTDPLFLTTPPIAPIDYTPQSGSYAINGGVTVPVWSDFFMQPRTGTYDIGAVNP